jgi:hypothetical protein
MSDLFTFKEPPVTNITITHIDGRKSVVDFSGDKVTFSGDLPVDKSAEIFFECVFKKQNLKIAINTVLDRIETVAEINQHSDVLHTLISEECDAIRKEQV